MYRLAAIASLLIALSISGCVTVVSTCYPLAERGPGRCPANDDWRRLMARAHENGSCDEGVSTRCCLIDGRQCCMDEREVRCSR